MSELGASLSWRRLGVLIRQLPLDARTVQVLGGEAVAWSVDTHLLAMLVDQGAAAIWQRGDGKGPKPKPLPRPGRVDPDAMGTAIPLNELRRRLHPEDFKEGGD